MKKRDKSKVKNLLPLIAVTIALISTNGELNKTKVHAFSEKEEKIKLLFVGDIHFEEPIKSNINKYHDPFKNIKDILTEKDLVIGNLETAITKNNEKNPKKYNFKIEEKYLTYLKNGKINLLSLANNHSYDYMEKGFEDTLESLKKYNINYVGGGDFKKSHTPTIIEIKGRKLCFLSYAHVNGGRVSIVTKEKIGINDGYDIKQVNSDIRDLESYGCFKKIILEHWGVENEIKPRDREVKRAKEYLSLGIDIVVGTHPHVVQKITEQDNKIIAYSLGNFLFYSSKEINRKNLGLSIEIDPLTGEMKIEKLEFEIDLKTKFPKFNKILTN